MDFAIFVMLFANLVGLYLIHLQLNDIRDKVIKYLVDIAQLEEDVSGIYEFVRIIDEQKQ